uniref:Hydroxylysine kinase n=1 Tax=Neogobius melanostomus TaxID=47308 RepID=A0A8C6S7S8_9GOBI
MEDKHLKPKLSLDQATDLLKHYDDQNFYVLSNNGDKYVLKIMNSGDSKNPSLIENGIPAQTAMPTVTGQLMSVEELDCGFGRQKYLVRLLSYLPGVTISKSPSLHSCCMRRDIILPILQMQHPHIMELERDGFIWSLSNLLVLEKYLYVLDGEPLQDVVRSVIDLYKTTVVPKYPHLRKCINHGDFNDLNILVQPDKNDTYKISGILDFGDMNSGFYIHELAITIMYIMTEHPNPIEVGGAVLAGWESELPLDEAERDCLYALVLSRFCQSLIFARYSVLLHPENEEYLMISSRKGVFILQDLWKLGKEHVEKVWLQSAAQYCSLK